MGVLEHVGRVCVPRFLRNSVGLVESGRGAWRIHSICLDVDAKSSGVESKCAEGRDAENKDTEINIHVGIPRWCSGVGGIHSVLRPSAMDIGGEAVTSPEHGVPQNAIQVASATLKRERRGILEPLPPPGRFFPRLGGARKQQNC
jgi:hypothetical protein